MATFAPKIDDTGVPNATGFSQGTGPNRTFEAIFSGLTETAKNVVNIKDTQTQLDIQDQAQKMFDQTNQEFGLDAPSTSPTGLTSELDRVQALADAAAQGKISQVNYYGRLATLSKQLRTKYPGYENIVDSTIQRVTGTRPANAYRDAIFEQLNQAASDASSEVKFQRQFNKENAGELSLLYGDDYFNDPSKYDFNKVQADVARLKGKAYSIKSQKDELDLMASQGTFNDKQAARVLDQDLNLVVQTTMNKSLGLNQPSAAQRINDFIASGGKGNLDEFVNQISLLESGLRTDLTGKVADYVSKRLISQDDGNKAIEAALYPVTKAKEAVLGGNFSLAAKYATLNKAIVDQQQSEMLKDPKVLAGSGLATIDKTLGENYFGANQGAVTTVAEEAAGRILAGTPGTTQQVLDSGNQQVTRNVLDMTTKMINDPKVAGTNFSNVIQERFGANAPDFMSPKVVAPSDLEALYLKFVNPETTAAIVKKGTPNDLKTYTDWALEKAQAIPSFRAAAGDVNSVASLDNLTVTYDPKSNRVQFFTADGTSLADNKFYARTLDSFNKVMTAINPILEANTGNEKDKLAMARSFVKGLNINLDGGDKRSLFQKIWEAMPTDLTESVGEHNKKNGQPVGNEVIPQGLESDGVIDFFHDRADELSQVGPDMNKAVGKVGSALKKVAGDLMTPVGTQRLPIAEGLKPFLTGGKGESSLHFLPQFGSNLEQFLNDAPGKGIKIFSGYRSPEHQAELFHAAVQKYGSVAAARRWVAPPGHSQHNKGNAADLRYATPEAQRWAHEHAHEYGLNFRMGHEPWHIELLP